MYKQEQPQNQLGQFADRGQFERECFSDFNRFVASFDVLEEVRGKKSVQAVEGLSEALASVSAWYASAIEFALAAVGDERAQAKFWDGVKAQLCRREPKFRRLEDFEKIRNNVVRTAALAYIFNAEGGEVTLGGASSVAEQVETIDVKKEVKDALKNAPDRGVAWQAVEVDRLDAELPMVRVQKGDAVYFVGALDAEAEQVKRFTAARPEERCFYILLNKKDYETNNGLPNPRTAAVARVQVDEWLRRQ